MDPRQSRHPSSTRNHREPYDTGLGNHRNQITRRATHNEDHHSHTSALSNDAPIGPSVLHGARGIFDRHVVVKPGAFCAVGGTQRVVVNTQLDSATLHGLGYPDGSRDPNRTRVVQDPSVLQNFQGSHLPPVDYGVTSFSAVGGNRTVQTRGQTWPVPCVQSQDTTVLRGASFLPPPSRNNPGAYGDGTHSAVASHHRVHRQEPNVLSHAADFYVPPNSVFREASFSAVGRDQMLTYQPPQPYHEPNNHSYDGRSSGPSRRR